MPTTPETIRKQFKVSKLCQVFQGILESCTEEGFARHRLHTLPSIALFEDDGRQLVVHDPQLACIFGIARQSPLNVPSQDLRAFNRQPPFEAVYLAMALGNSTKVIPRRIRLLQEAELLLLDLCEKGTAHFVVAISHRRLIHGRIVIRHQPVCILDLDGGVIWLHPAAQRFGLIEATFPRSQRHRQVDHDRSWRDRNPLAGLRQDAEGFPPWYHQARENLGQNSQVDPVADAFLDMQERTMLQFAIEVEAEERLQFAAQEFLAEFESYFGMGGLFPEPGIIDIP